MQTLLLDTVTWDLLVDANQNIAVASDPYSMAQDAASAIRTFNGEVWYDTTIGTPFFGDILGTQPPPSLIKADLVEQALLVPGVVAAQCFISSITGRSLAGQVQIADQQGKILAAANF